MLSKCQICLEDANPSVVTKCGHIYCRGCLNGWMDISHSNRSCPICKCQLKKEEFHELTSEVCSICQNKPKLPVLTTSGSLSCWACHYKTLCDQVIPIYGTEDGSEEKADPAVPPRPVRVGGNPTNFSNTTSSIESGDIIVVFLFLIGLIGLIEYFC